LVHGWEPGLRSAVDNLLVNALNHGRDGDGRARIAVTLHPGGGQDGPAAVLTVDDQGPGVPADRREAVFQRFNRRADSPGSGLGLTLVAQQIALHRGRIRILDGAGGRGARFEVTLPVTGPGDREMTLPL